MAMNQVEYAAHRGVKKQYINKLVRTGVIPLDANKRIDPVAADAILAAQADPSRDGVVKANAERYGKPLNPAIQRTIPLHPDEAAVMAGLPKLPDQPTKQLTFSEAKTARETALAATAAFDLDVKRGEYVARDVAGSLAKGAGKAWRNLLTEVQATLPSVLLGVVKEKAPKLDSDVYQLIEHGFRLAVANAHRTALKQVADQVQEIANSHDATTN